MESRRTAAERIRQNAADLASARDHPRHISNGEERSRSWYAMNFTKGLPHDHTTGCLAHNADYEQFVRAIDSGDPRDFVDTPLGPKGSFKVAPEDARVRAWESQGAGLAFDLEGPDAQAVTMPPAPTAESPELAAEITEVYAQALLRDEPLTALRSGGVRSDSVYRAIDSLNSLPWFQSDDIGGITTEAQRRRRGPQSRQTAFRGIAPGDDVGPYLSQFLLVGTNGLDGTRDEAEGLIQYGSQTIDQRVRQVETEDFMVTWDSWFDVQNGVDVRGTEKYVANERFITTGRDLATYVHYDALYQAYLNACLILLGRGVPFDPGVPFQAPDVIDHQQGFAHFGGPHILSLVTEVATRALKAVRFQKFNVHRRLRPEALGGRLTKADLLPVPGLVATRDAVLSTEIGAEIQLGNKAASGRASLLLPMAFPEGSPMHPSYGAGHATVAGACVTVLKAFFDHSTPFEATGTADKAYVPNPDGSELTLVDVENGHGARAELSVEGELNKLAANISIGRDWAGVHYFSDYWESMLMGEQIAIAILEEQKLGFAENFSMTIPLFSGGAVRI